MNDTRRIERISAESGRSNALDQLRRRVVVGNVMGYAGMLGVLLIYFKHAPANPFLYGVAGVAVGTGTGLAYLSLLSIRRIKHTAGGDAPR